MLFEVRGADRLRRVARILRETGNRGMQRELHAGLNRAVRPFRTALVSHLGAYLPSGYAPLVAASLKVKATGGGSRVRVTTTAGGKTAKRDLSALNAGILRHPVWGRSRFVRRSGGRHRDVRSANPWVTQRVRPGFYDDQTRDLADGARRECERVIDDVARRIEGGT